VAIATSDQVMRLPKEKAKTFAHRLIEALSGNHDVATVDMIDSLSVVDSLDRDAD